MTYLVIDIGDDWEPEALKRELGFLQASGARVEEYDPEDRDGGLSLQTEDISIEVDRIVGIAESVAGAYDVIPLEDL